MDWKYLFLRFDGRISRKPFWIGAIILAVAGIALSFLVLGAVLGGIVNGGDISPEAALAYSRFVCWGNIAVFLILAWPAAALMIKRRHDRDSAGYDVWAYLGLSLFSQLLGAFSIDYAVVTDPATGITSVAPGFFSGTIGFAVLLVAIYLVVVCGVLKGTAGPNSYGPDPLA